MFFQAGVTADVYALTLTPDSSSGEASFYIEMDVPVGTMQSQDLFESLLRNAIDGTLVNGYTVQPESVQVDTITTSFGKIFYSPNKKKNILKV